MRVLLRSNPSNRMELAEQFIRQITKDTQSEDRLVLAQTLLRDVSKQTSDGVQYDGDTVSEIVRVLLRVTLDSDYNTSKLREWLLSLEVKDVVFGLTAGPGTASAVLRGMLKAVEEKGVGFEDFITWCGELAGTWFVSTNGTVAPTSPGFIFCLFEFRYLSGDRQEDACGHRKSSFADRDRHLLPLVAAALHTETGESINKSDREGHTALHIASSVSRLPQVTRALLGHPDIDVNVRDNKGRIPLARLVERSDLDDDESPSAHYLLEHPSTNVTILDNRNKTVLDHCLDNLAGPLESVKVAVQLIGLICEHPTATPDMITLGLERLTRLEVPESLRAMYNDVIVKLAANTKFNINTFLRDGKTICHLAASQKKGDIVMKLIDITGFDPKIPDSLGNTILYYVCANLPTESAIAVLDHSNVTWDFAHRNKGEQTVLDYYERLPDSKRDPLLLAILEKRVGRVTVNVGRQAAQRQVPEVALYLPIRPILWTSHAPGQGSGTPVKVLPATPDIMTRKLDLVSQDQVYPMDNAAKGRCCIISVPTFEVPWLIDLPGYHNDSQRLGELWLGLGFEVTLPSCHGDRYLTAQEIEKSVEEFSQSLSGSDQCVVLTLLSHGGEGFVYGSDGNKVHLERLFRCLDNERCPVMAGKPKVVVIQACAGSATDLGVTAGHRISPAVMAADPRLDLPTMSDFIICSPSLAGLASYVYNTPGRGSVFLEAFVDIFSQRAKEDDIHTLMTWVNHKVSKARTLVAHPGGHSANCKQMSRIESCLTKLLYFYPGTEQNPDKTGRQKIAQIINKNIKYILWIVSSIMMAILLHKIWN